MTQKLFTNMSSNLKRTKFYFLLVAIFCFLVILFCYNWNVAENFYTISSEFSQERLSQMHLPDVVIREKSVESVLEVGTRESSTDSMNNKSKEFKNVVVDRTSQDRSALQSDLGTLRNKNLGTILGNDNEEMAEDINDFEETERNVDVKEKVSQTINETNDLSGNNTADYSKMISKSFVPNTKSTTKADHMESLRENKEETRKILNKIHKLKEEISGDHQSPSSLRRTKSRFTNPKYHGIRKNETSHLATGRDIQTFQRLKNRLKSLGLMNRLQAYNIDTYSNATSRPEVCVGCFENNFRKIINEPNLCNGDVELLLMVASSFSRKDSRNAIRNTWCRDCNKPNSKIKLVFVFGNRNDSTDNRNLLEESKQFHDIIQLDFKDSYVNLTYKTISSLQWSEEYCKEAKYTMKTDDDMFVNTELLSLVLKAAPSEQFIGGVCWGPQSPHRDSSSKWHVSFNQYQQSLFPSMCSGTGYVMSRDVVSGILRQSPNVPFFHLEDVYVAICVRELRLHPVKLKGFANTRIDFDPCRYRNQVITSHEFSAELIEYMWNESRSCPQADLTPEMVYVPLPV